MGANTPQYDLQHDLQCDPKHDLQRGEVVKLDRGFPLVELANGERIRCEHATDLEKHGGARAVIGDIAYVSMPKAHDVGVIEQLAPRKTVLVRKDPTDRALPQILAANFDRILIAQPLTQLNLKRLERELVLAHQTGAAVSIVLTKADLAEGGSNTEAAQETVRRAREIAGDDVEVAVISASDAQSIERVRRLIPEGTTAVAIGRSGVGKSTLINLLAGNDHRATGCVRASDGKGRHTTVSREIVQIPGAGRIVDMPGVRGLGLWDATEGIETAFSDIESLAQDCRFRDCKHGSEPGCAVLAAVADGRLSAARLESYRSLQDELASTNERRRRATWRN